MTKKKKFLITLGVISTIVIVIFLAALLYSYSCLYKVRKLISEDKTLAEAEEIYEEYLKKIPDSENAALVFKKLEDYELLEHPKSMSHTLILEDIKLETFLSPTQEQIGLLRKLIHERKEVLVLIDEATELEMCSFDPIEDNKYFFSYSLLIMREIGKVLAFDAMLAAHEGDSVRATSRCLQILKLAELYKQEPDQIAYFISVACVSNALKVINMINRLSAISYEQTNEIVAKIQSIDSKSDFSKVQCFEKLLMVDAFDKMTLHTGGIFFAKRFAHMEAFPKFFKRILLRADSLEYYTYISNLMDHSLHPYFDSHSDGKSTIYYDFPWYAYVTRSLSGEGVIWQKPDGSIAEEDYPRPRNFENYLASNTKYIARLQMVTIHLLAGDIVNNPDITFEDIAQVIENKELLIDPFTGGSLKLIVRDGETFLYSVGKNQKDDMGSNDYKIDGDDISYCISPVMIEVEEGE